MISMDIRLFVLENAVKYNGKASIGSVVGKILAEHPEEKSRMKELMSEIKLVVDTVNSMSPEEQVNELLEHNPHYYKTEKEESKKRAEERKELPELKNAVMGQVVTRIPPEPSKYNHVGHAITFLLNYMYAKKYQGKCILRYEDTNPEKSTQEFVDAMNEDVLEYLDIHPDQVVFVSDHLLKYIEMAGQLITDGHAYTCRCLQEKISHNRREMIDCSCRETTHTSNDWQSMKAGKFVEGEITLRLKISMQHKNAVMRDPVIFRLCYDPHYRQGMKYKVWPVYDFENAIEEGLLGVTHVLRSNEFESRIELQEYIRNLFSLPHPTIKQYARVNIADATTQGREIRALIESGNYLGWDDPRLVTLRALKRRGIVKEAYFDLAKVVGMSKTPSEIDFAVIASINRKLLDASAKRFFFIHHPKMIQIKQAPPLDVDLKFHPDGERGRTFHTSDEFYIEEEDYHKFVDGELIRLMDCLNFTKEKKIFSFESVEHEKYRGSSGPIIHWLPVDNIIDVEVLMPDISVLKGYGEGTLSILQIGDVIQFERFAFCRLDSIENGVYKFWYTHK